MNYELTPLTSWLLIATFLILITVTVIGSWVISTEIGYDKGFQSGYRRGLEDTRQYKRDRETMLREDNEYLMAKVVDLKDRIKQ